MISINKFLLKWSHICKSNKLFKDFYNKFCKEKTYIIWHKNQFNFLKICSLPYSYHISTHSQLYASEGLMDIKSQKLKIFGIRKRYRLKSCNDSFNQFQKYINLIQAIIHLYSATIQIDYQITCLCFSNKMTSLSKLSHQRSIFIVLFSFISS